MARNPLASNAGYPKVTRNKKLYSKRRSGAGVAPSPQELLQESINSQQLAEHAQHQIKLLVDRVANLQLELIELAHKEARLRHLAYHDGLTGLPNRSLLQDRFHQAMSQAERQRKPLALLMVDLNEFKRVNDKLGHTSGDKLLQAVALRLGKGIRGADTACRYGGDEFVIMLPEIDSPDSAAALAAEIGGRLREAYLIDGHKINMAVSVGVAVYPGDGQTFDDLIKQADIAMYRAKGTRHSICITEQTKEDADRTEWHAPALKNAERLRERASFIQDEWVHGQGQQKSNAKYNVN